MPPSTKGQRQTIERLLDRHGETYAAELGINLSRPGPAALFRLLTASLLFSARISADIAVAAARALSNEGWTTPQKMTAATWAQRTKTLNRSGYARYDESTSRMLGDTADLLVDRYRGDLRRLREEAGHDAKRARTLLKECKGIGDVGVDIFFREVQVAWDELAPFADQRSLRAATRLKLPGDAAGLAELVPARRFPDLVAALVRADLADDLDELAEAR